MSERCRVHKVASVVNRLRIGEGPRDHATPRCFSGNAIVVRALDEKRVYDEIELTTGRMAKVGHGDVIVGALGRRARSAVSRATCRRKCGRATSLHLLNHGGSWAGASATAGPRLPGRAARCWAWRSRWQGPQHPRRAVADRRRHSPLATAAAHRRLGDLHQLRQDCRPLGDHTRAHGARPDDRGGKMTGVACLNDLHGARGPRRGRDAILPRRGASPRPPASRLRSSRGGEGDLAELARSRPDLIVVEMGDGIIGDYGVLSLLLDPQVRRTVRVHGLCANDLVGAWGGVHFLSDLASPRCFRRPRDRQRRRHGYIEAHLGRPAINAYRVPERLAAALRRQLDVDGLRPTG